MQQDLLDMRRAMRDSNCTASSVKLDSDNSGSSSGTMPGRQMVDALPSEQPFTDSSTPSTGSTAARASPQAQEQNDIGSTGSSPSSRSNTSSDLDSLDQPQAVGSLDIEREPVRASADVSEPLPASAAQTRHERRARRHGAASESRDSLSE